MVNLDRFDFIDRGDMDFLGQVEGEDLTRLELLEDNQWVGNIYRARVDKVLEGMECAFVDIGFKTNAFLPKKFMRPENKEGLKAGDTIFVEVKKTPLGDKGATVSMDISIKGEDLVLLPKSQGIKLSKKLDRGGERDRLEAWGRSKNLPLGLIIRTSAQGKAPALLDQELKALLDQVEALRRERNFLPTPKLLLSRDPYESFLLDREASLPLVTNSRASYKDLLARGLKKDLVIYDPDFTIQGTGVFRRQIDDLFVNQVPLKNGANIVIDQTEALTVIDVNSGKKTGGKDFSSLADETNDLAAQALVKQIRLRNLSGMFVVDFLESNRDPKVLKDRVEGFFKGDPLKSQVFGYTQMGLFEISRQRAKDSLPKRIQNLRHRKKD
ncbi:MAG: ribonuclease E/G [Tissierellia bacterium]|nr:ribonuclease E/G [Tissierellia bacterium]